jgi:putative transcriptional regulator
MKDKKIENCVQKYREEKSITQETLAKDVGVTRQTIIAIEKGNYTPSVLLAIKISNYFKVPVKDLFKIKE